MVFGFGGSSKPAAPATSSRQELLKNQIKQEFAYQQAAELIDSISHSCFDSCITNPGSSLSSSEQTCVNKCMDRYMEAWNVVSRTYIARIQKEAVAPGP